MRIAISSVLVACAAAVASAGEPDRSMIQRIKSATVFVHDGKRGEGSAFCVDESGWLLTSAQVVGKHQELTAVFNAGLTDQVALPAKVVRLDVHWDLALLKVTPTAKLVALPLGSTDELVEQLSVFSTGFPFGLLMATKKGEFPTVSVHSGKITSLRQISGQVSRVQIDNEVARGSYGGPLIDAKGKVVGVVIDTKKITKVQSLNSAAPVNHVREFLGKPEVEVKAPAIAFGNRFKPAAFEVRAVPPIPVGEAYEVDLVFAPQTAHERSFRMKAEPKGVYRVSAEPVRSLDGAPAFKVTLVFPTGGINGLVADRTLKIAGQDVRLSEIRSIRFAMKTLITLNDGRVLDGPVVGLEELPVSFGSTVIKLDPAKTKEMTLAPDSAEPHVDYAIVVRSKDKVIAQVSDRLRFTDVPASFVPVDPAKEAEKINGFWVLDRTESISRRTWPQDPEQAIFIENKKIYWATKEGKLPPNAPEADLEVDAAKTPHELTLKFRRGPTNQESWQAIYKIEGDILTIATNADEKSRPALYTIRATPGSAQYVMRYRRVTE